jgi:hypothetical protein
MSTEQAQPYRDVAYAAAARGWHVFPVSPGRKTPPAITKWETRATTDPDRIDRAWASTGWNVGVATGPSGLVVVDLDVPKSNEGPAPAPWNQLGITCGADVLAAITERARQPWPHTYTVQTPAGGLHLYFTAPAGQAFRNSQSKLGWKIDTRAGGGYVLAAGSTVEHRPYVVIDERDPVQLPFWIAFGLTVAPLPPAPPPDRPVLTGRRASAYLAAAIRAESDRIRTAPRGRHNWCLYLASVALGQLVAGRALSHADAHAALRAAVEHHVASECGCTAAEVEKTIASGLRAGHRRPRTAAA